MRPVAPFAGFRDVGTNVAEALVVRFERDDLIWADVAEALVVRFERDDLIWADVAQALVSGAR